MSKVPDAWEDEWSTVADTPNAPHGNGPESRKPSTRVTKAQRRAQQAEFNKQFWAEAEGPTEPNYFLESRNIVPLRQEFKPAPILLSRKGPIVQSQAPRAPTEGLGNLTIASRNDSSEEEEESEESRQKALEKRQAQAARDREEKQRKYEERRLELFGPPAQNNTTAGLPNNRSGNSSPGSNTPPHSRSSTPNSRGRRGRGRGATSGPQISGQYRVHQQQPQYQLHQHQQQLRELYDPQYSQRPDLASRQTQTSLPASHDVQPIRAPRGPDGSGRGGFGFSSRGGKQPAAIDSEP